MPDITLVKKEDIGAFTEQEIAIVKRFHSTLVDGLGEPEIRKWRRFWFRVMNNLEVGELVHITTRMERSGPFHRRHLKIETVVFESQDTFDNFDMFREWLLVGSGHVEWMPNPYGGLPVPRAKSISFNRCEDGEMREVHTKAMRFLRSDRALSQLWPHLDSIKGLAMIDSILMGFNE